MNKKLISLTAAAVMVLSVPFNAYAHGGRTDGSGGHRDNKNVSGLGYYHYHCGGYPAHLHENGVCPYKNSSSDSSSTSASTTNTSSQSKAEWIGDMYWDGEKFADGWTVIGGKTYYFKYNSYVTGWCEDEDGNVYYFSKKRRNADRLAGHRRQEIFLQHRGNNAHGTSQHRRRKILF